ncbi:hypothetical protein A1E_02775 [Rickettsia canadensis str. McKiel]|uniref:Uncharacterized protein n=1 Tax=Rickettsia canadensis (strain McKiel) TaxID=293613 RepID=A8EYR6_RICCK|nr:hypothetical protein A1E_02775 [Rickettsia canadensis str. McKiel]
MYIQNYDLSLKIHLKPETVKYNYSKTCRAIFRDNKCNIDKVYIGLYKVKEILKKSLRILALVKKTAIITAVKSYSARIVLVLEF